MTEKEERQWRESVSKALFDILTTLEKIQKDRVIWHQSISGAFNALETETFKRNQMIESIQANVNFLVAEREAEDFELETKEMLAEPAAFPVEEPMALGGDGFVPLKGE